MNFDTHFNHKGTSNFLFAKVTISLEQTHISQEHVSTEAVLKAGRVRASVKKYVMYGKLQDVGYQIGN